MHKLDDIKKWEERECALSQGAEPWRCVKCVSILEESEPAQIHKLCNMKKEKMQKPVSALRE